MFVSTQGLHALLIRQDAREKRHLRFGLCGDQIGIFGVFKPSGKNTKNRIRYLKFLLVAVWIYICLDMKYLSIWISKSV